jgi:hypothetical protein
VIGANKQLAATRTHAKSILGRKSGIRIDKGFDNQLRQLGLVRRESDDSPLERPDPFIPTGISNNSARSNL